VLDCVVDDDDDDDAAEPSARLLQTRHSGPQEMDGSREGLTSSKSSKATRSNKQQAVLWIDHVHC